MNSLIASAIISCWLLCCFGSWASEVASSNGHASKRNHTNILLILADDLGYGDLSIPQFSFSGIQTPNLERMAAKGTIMTNYHTAAATCTPTRASILTGMYPWRLGLKAVYEYGEKYKSNRDDWLPQVPTTAMVFKENNYFTGHSGKWHLGGMRNDDFDMRTLPPNGDPAKNLAPRKCPHPGPNQQGFDEYVSVLDGPGSRRQCDLQVRSVLYSEGCSALIRNDVLIGRQNGTARELLSDCEARHAIRMMNESVSRNQPFFVHVWFHAPHGPWEYIPEFDIYNTPVAHRGRRMAQYKTMVTAMDRAVGTLLAAVSALGIEENTLIVFTSDNGPEPDAGHTGFLREKKRFIYEGGIRVPAIFQWVNTIPAGAVSEAFAVSTDLFPTFLHAANIHLPMSSSIRLDGMSILPELVPTLRQHATTVTKNKKRTTFWHNDFEGPRKTAIWVNDFKIFLDEHENPAEMFDMRVDKYEKVNLLNVGHSADRKRQYFVDYENSMTEQDWKSLGVVKGAVETNIDSSAAQPHHQHLATPVIDYEAQRNNTILHHLLVSRAFPYMLNFANHGSDAYKQYLVDNPERKYPETPESDQRNVGGNIYRYTSKEQGQANRKLNMGNVCLEACSCTTPVATGMPTLPFDKVFNLTHSLWPGEQPKVTSLLHIPIMGNGPHHHHHQQSHHHGQHASSATSATTATAVAATTAQAGGFVSRKAMADIPSSKNGGGASSGLSRVAPVRGKAAIIHSKV